MNIRLATGLIALSAVTSAYAASPVQPGPQLLCHRTANEDVPENTLESLEQAALLGCNVVEIDLRRTLDGKIVLNHDGILERLTDGTGEVEQSYYEDLQLRDAGSWMADRFSGMHMALFEDSLRLAREMDIRLVLDMKTKGMGAEVLQIVQREGMLERVQFNGEWQDVRELDPGATDAGDHTAWVQPGVTQDAVKALHKQGKAVIANFSANGHEMDISAMKAAVAAGVDGINVDFPRLGADAVGRPVERKLHDLILQADTGAEKDRIAAILELARYSGFSLENMFEHWLLDPNDRISRAAALALVKTRPQASLSVFTEALRSPYPDVRANAAWALGMLKAPAAMLDSLMDDKDIHVLEQTLLALARMPGDVSADRLLSLLQSGDPSVRGAVAIALASHDPQVAAAAVSNRLQLEMKAERIIYDDYVKRGRPQLTPPEIAKIMASFRCQMEMMRAISTIPGEGATTELFAQAFRPSDDFSQMNSIVAAFQLWDRVKAEPRRAIDALGAKDAQVAGRAEWMLVKAGPTVLPEVRSALFSDNREIRRRAIRIVAWQGDIASLPRLTMMKSVDQSESDLAAWAIQRIRDLHPDLLQVPAS